MEEVIITPTITTVITATVVMFNGAFRFRSWNGAFSLDTWRTLDPMESWEAVE